MTDPVVVVGGVQERGRKSGQENLSKREKTKHFKGTPEDDSVDISQDARDRASGKKRRNILEYLEDQESS
jgi:hypothetical protein